ncbi:anti-sigma factor antagonist [Actinoplanes ianthinogenes]|uniref:Anti-sigma factor antagonist n=1 Tax=Actinoplanes ianthinogenes TaxID=122358 RepID=A0ABM7M8U4_9ACTN|nr:STAS domain-containing protein [Actinoplanes ianthinogenes]BCJ48011.1 anti-sigma factor antagonist [Actinoplanes ianthinogenes]GGR05763.1 anti-sigma factor antagonist [Actinoplanes ianthinogenes]
MGRSQLTLRAREEAMQWVNTAANPGGSLRVVLRGDIDFTNSGEVIRSIRAGAADATGPDIEVDLAEVTFLDSSGIAVLVRLLHLAEQRGGSLSLQRPTDKVRDQLYLAGLAELLGTSGGPPSWLGR